MKKRELIISYTKKDFDVTTFVGTGPGGQHRNKTQSCVRIEHIPTGLVASSCTSRYQGQNKKTAFFKLAEKIKKYHTDLIYQERYRPTDVIRTYNEPDNRVVDKQSGFQQPYDEVINDISDMVDIRRQNMRKNE